MNSTLDVNFLNKYFVPMPILEKEPSKMVEKNIKRTLERKKVKTTKRSPKSVSKKVGLESETYNTGRAISPWYNEIPQNVTMSKNFNFSNSAVNLLQEKQNFYNRQLEWHWNQPNISSPASLSAPHPSYYQSPIRQLPQPYPPQYTSEVYNSVKGNDPTLRTSPHYCQQSASNGQQPTLQYLPQTPASKWNCSPPKEMMPSMSQNALQSNLHQESNMQQSISQDQRGHPDSALMSVNSLGKHGSFSSQRIAQNTYNQSQSSDHQFPNQKLHPRPFQPHAINSLPIASHSDKDEQHTPKYTNFNHQMHSKSSVDRPNWRYLPPHYSSLHTLKQDSQCSAFPSDPDQLKWPYTIQQPQQVNRAHQPLLKPDGHNNLPQQMRQDYHHQQQQQPMQEVPAYPEIPPFEHRTTFEKQLRQVPVPQHLRSNEHHFPINYQPYCCALNNKSGSENALAEPIQECQNSINLSGHHKNASQAHGFLRQYAQQQQSNFTRQKHYERGSSIPMEFDGQAKEQPNHQPQLHNNQLMPSITNNLPSDHQLYHLTQQHFNMQNQFVSDQFYKQQAARQSYLERFQEHRRQTELPHISKKSGDGEEWLQELIESALNPERSCPAGKNESVGASSKSKISTNNREVGKSNKGETVIENVDVGNKSALKINVTKPDRKTQHRKVGGISKKGIATSKDVSTNRGKSKSKNTKSEIDQNRSLVDVLFQESINLLTGIQSLQKKQLNKHEQEKYVSFDSNNNQPNGQNSTNEENSPQIEHITVEWISDGDAQEKDDARQPKLFEYYEEDQAVCGMEFDLDLNQVELKLSNEVLNENVTDRTISGF